MHASINTEDRSALKIKKVRFAENPSVRVMIVWEYASRSARRGEWEQAARDRARFQMRIERSKKILDPVLEVALCLLERRKRDGEPCTFARGGGAPARSVCTSAYTIDA